jgi:hypothetical protein
MAWPSLLFPCLSGAGAGKSPPLPQPLRFLPAAHLWPRHPSSPLPFSPTHQISPTPLLHMGRSGWCPELSLLYLARQQLSLTSSSSPCPAPRSIKLFWSL